MARFLFASTAFRAHLDWGGLLATAVCLARSGHTVVWATDAGRLPAIGRAGLDVVSIPVVDPYRGGMGRDDQLDRTESVALWRAALRGHGAEEITATPATSRAYAWLVRSVIDAWIQEEALARSCEALIAVIDRWQPDVVIGEPLMLPARIAASARGVPLAGCGYPGALLAPEPLPAIAPALARVCRILRRLRARVGSTAASDEPELFCWSEPLQIVFFPPDWYGDLRARPSPNVRYVGGGRAPGERRPEPERRQVDPPLVVVGSSTSYPPAPQVLHAIFEAVRRVGGRVVTAAPDETRASLEPLPPHVTWEPWVSYDDILPRAAAIVHHGGLGTTHAAVRAACPQLILPGPVDQILHAEAVARCGAGICYVGPLVADAMGPLLGDLLSTPAYRNRAAALRDRFAACGGVPRAVDLLVGLASG